MQTLWRRECTAWLSWHSWSSLCPWWNRPGWIRPPTKWSRSKASQCWTRRWTPCSSYITPSIVITTSIVNTARVKQSSYHNGSIDSHVYCVFHCSHYSLTPWASSSLIQSNSSLSHSRLTESKMLIEKWWHNHRPWDTCRRSRRARARRPPGSRACTSFLQTENEPIPHSCKRRVPVWPTTDS